MKNFLNLAHLKFFCDAVIYKSISEAAKLNYVSQSAVSQAIAKLERTLSAQLLIHSRQKFLLTEVGRAVFEQASLLFKNVDGIYERINQEKETISGELRFVLSRSVGMSFLPSVYKQAELLFPQVKLNFELGGRNFIRKALRQHEAEFAIIVYDQDFSSFAQMPLKKGVFQFYQSLDAPTQLIEKGVYVDYLEGPSVLELRKQLEVFRPSLKIKGAVSSWEAVARFAEAGVGVGFFPDYLMRDHRYPTLKVYPTQLPPIPYEICAIYNKEQPLSRLARTFLNLFAEKAER